MKIGHFTVDNAENNVIMMKHLELLLAACELPLEFDAADRRVMCFPHIMNICVQHVIDEFSAPDLVAIAKAWVDGLDDEVEKNSYLDAVKKNLVALGCDIVRVIRASGIRRDEFTKTIATGNLQEWFKNPAAEIVKVPETQLLRDVRTRWDSTFYMINRLRALQPAVDLFLSLPTQKDLTKYQMDNTEWFVLKEYELVLGVSGSPLSYRTSSADGSCQLRYLIAFNNECLPNHGLCLVAPYRLSSYS